MAGGQKKWRKRTMAGTAAAEGHALHWELVSEPSWSSSARVYKGLCISVRVTGEARRELMIEYPFPTDKGGRPLPVPQRPPVSQAMVEQAIGEAVAAGWDPGSRGKAFVLRPERSG